MTLQCLPIEFTHNSLKSVEYNSCYISLTLETGRTWFRRAWLQSPNSMIFLVLTSTRDRAQWVALGLFKALSFVRQSEAYRSFLRRAHRVCHRTQWVLSSTTALSKQYFCPFPFAAHNDPHLLQLVRSLALSNKIVGKALPLQCLGTRLFLNEVCLNELRINCTCNMHNLDWYDCVCSSVLAEGEIEG